MRRYVPAFLGLVALAWLSGCDGDTPCTLVVVGGDVVSAPAGVPHEVAVACMDPEGTPRPGQGMIASVEAGGGRLASVLAIAGSDGQARFTWTLGPVPVDQRLVVRRRAADAAPEPGDEVGVTLRATLETPHTPATFGNVESVLASAGITGTTEDLAFSADALVMAVPGHRVNVDASGAATLAPLTGDPLEGPLGIAFDADGLLWVADSTGQALRTVDAEGTVTTRLTTNGTRALGQPNYVAVGPDGALWLSDPCLGEVLRFDPVAETVAVVAAFDLATQGGPNGLAFDATGALWLTTENVGLLCMNGAVDPFAPVAGLFRIDANWAQRADPSTRARPILESFAHFGDGLAFDAEGNLYALFDHIDVDNLALASSELHVIAAADLAATVASPSIAGTPPATSVLLSTQDVVMANLAWGRGDFGATRIYLSLLAIPPFGLETRGVVMFETGIPGAGE